MDIPDVRYARSGGASIAYQVVGEGPIDLVFVPFLFNLAFGWTHPKFARLLDRLSAFARVIAVDKRGTGLSDRFREVPTLETRMDDLRAVLDEVGSEGCALMGSFEGAQMTALFAATYPERTQALVLYNPVARFVSDDAYPWGLSLAEFRSLVKRVADGWGRRDFMVEHLRSIDSGLATDPDFVDWYVTFFRLAASPGAAAAFYRMMMDTDIRDVLPAIRVPTLVCFREDYQEPSRFVADRIPGARALEVEGIGYLPSAPESMFEEIERFLLGAVDERETDRVLTTVLFTDLCDSTEVATRLGDHAWAHVMKRHRDVVRAELARFQGAEVDTAGDGFLATFEGPARAIRCACAIVEQLKNLGLAVRAGVHTGECELLDGKVAGIAVNIGARIASQASAGEVLVSSTVKDLVAGSRLAFEDRGEHELKGVPGSWRIYAVAT